MLKRIALIGDSPSDFPTTDRDDIQLVTAGMGYPNELEGEAIPQLARMVKIIDVFCAMTSPCIYRDTVATKDQAFEYMQEERGKQFDPELVDVFIQNDVGGEAVPQA